MRLLSTAVATTGLLLLALSVGVALADSSVSIKETNGKYAYTPKTTTVNVGDTVTWTNDSDAPHTVDADNGSFDHGRFTQGQSVSQTFAKAGTFAYHCDIHDYMHGTVVVLAAGLTPPATDTVPTATGSQSGTWFVLIGLGSIMLMVAFAIRSRRQTA
jgi:LPXTG-motif cell wall-anchored protein